MPKQFRQLLVVWLDLQVFKGSIVDIAWSFLYIFLVQGLQIWFAKLLVFMRAVGGVNDVFDNGTC